MQPCLETIDLHLQLAGLVVSQISQPLLVGVLAESTRHILLLFLQLPARFGILLTHGIQPIGFLALVVAHPNPGNVRIDGVLSGLEHHLHGLAVGLGAVAPDLRKLLFLLRPLLDGGIGVRRVQVLDAELHLGGGDLAGGLGLAQALHSLGQVGEPLFLRQRPIDDRVEGLDLILQGLGAVFRAFSGILIGLLLRLDRACRRKNRLAICFGEVSVFRDVSVGDFRRIAIILQACQLLLKRSQVGLPCRAHADLRGIVRLGGRGVFFGDPGEHPQCFGNQA
ncbi:hypothetical protein D3C81_1199530 [compost metagenome]